MTTIAYKDGVLACDSAWTNGTNCVATLHTKMYKLASGAYVGEAGDNDSRAVRDLLNTVRCFEKLPSAKQLADTRVDYAALVVFPDGRVAEILIEHDDKKGWTAQVWEVNRGIAAVGSGGELAIGHMGAGKSAAEAVAFCCDWDPNSKLPVHAVNVKELQRKKRR